MKRIAAFSCWSILTVLGCLTSQANDICRQVVELCDVELDFTGLAGIVIDHNRSLIASPACARGPRSLGPRIFVTDKRPDKTPLFRIRDSNVLFSGFRLEGPTSDIGSDDDNREAGISVDPFSLPGPLHDVEISNMEIFHWRNFPSCNCARSTAMRSAMLRRRRAARS